MTDEKPLRLEWVDPTTLNDHPNNWRRHPEHQRQAFVSLRDRVGWAGALLYNESTERLINGHMRKSMSASGEPVPVLVGNWTEEEELLILASLDPIAAMAEEDEKILASLQAEIDGHDDFLAKILEQEAGMPVLLEERLEIKPRQTFHVLISAPVDSALEVRAICEQAEAIDGVEVEYGAN